MLECEIREKNAGTCEERKVEVMNTLNREISGVSF